MTKKGNLRVLVIGLGNMGMAHARAYDKIDGFELAGLCSGRAPSGPIFPRNGRAFRFSPNMARRWRP